MNIWVWVAFHAVIFAILALDLGVLNRKSHVQTVQSALGWTAFWVALSLGFCGLIHYYIGPPKSLEWLSAYVIEYSLSIDNIFVFALVFSFFRVPAEHQHKVLFWGIIGAFVMRAVMISVGTAIIEQFYWVEYLFGAFLIYTGIKLAFGGEAEVKPEKNFALNALRRIMPVTDEFEGGKFLTLANGRRAATPLLAVLLVVETTDLVFAVDSIPATLAVVKSKDEFIAYTANICAILGLRSLYFALAGIMGMFEYLKYGLAVVLGFVGIKMLLGHTAYAVSTPLSLGIIVFILTVAIGASLLRPNQEKNEDKVQS